MSFWQAEGATRISPILKRLWTSQSDRFAITNCLCLTLYNDNMRRFLILVSVLVVILITTFPARADELDDINSQLTKLSADLQASIDATKPLESDLAELKGRLNSIRGRITTVERDISQKEIDIKKGEQALAREKQILDTQILIHYKNIKKSEVSLLSLLVSENLPESLANFFYQKKATDESKQTILQIALYVTGIEKQKKALESEKGRLASVKIEVDKQSQFLSGEIGKAKNYQTELSGKIAELSAKQQQILGEKSGTFQTTVGDVPLADDAASSPSYNPGFSPAFAAFSFGAPHFKGMSQYGAYGRSKSGQNYETILRAYYGGGIEIRDVDQNTQITVDGYGPYSIEEYAKRIYEMPGSWGDSGGTEALKAQAIAARSYALARGGTICATESCQVFKPEPKGGNWESAVNATAGKVVYANGAPLSTWYASTSGGYQESYSANGYSTPGFWDTASGRSGWTSQAYEKIANSPWFYKGWYKSRSGDSCGKSHPWLNSEEMADILNAWVVLIKHGHSDDRVTPIGPCWGGNPYSNSDLRGVAASLSTGYSSVSGVSVAYAENGITANVTFSTDKGSVSIGGSDFKKAFNLRAPGRISLKSGLFNIERK